MAGRQIIAARVARELAGLRCGNTERRDRLICGSADPAHRQFHSRHVLGRLAISREAVHPAEIVVVHPRRVRRGHFYPQRHIQVVQHSMAPGEFAGKSGTLWRSSRA
jgi:hypothetical protein